MGNSGLVVDETGTRAMIFWGDKWTVQVGPSTWSESQRFGVKDIILSNLAVRANA